MPLASQRALLATTELHNLDKAPRLNAMRWGAVVSLFFQLDGAVPPSSLRIAQNNNTNNEITF